jgi:HD-GYP domain-containing protein (c-di-GMP phosphodiesterase class II)
MEVPDGPPTMPLLYLSNTSSIPLAMLQCLEGLDPTIARHGHRVSQHARAMGEVMGLSPATLSWLELAGKLHDIGKLFIPAFLVHKQASFNLEEYRILQGHVVLGARLLEGHHETEVLARVARHHHERWDGSGYPSHLAGMEIPLLARIVSVADAYDAVTSDRSGGNRCHDAAMEEILRGRGTQFCPEAVEASLLVELEWMAAEFVTTRRGGPQEAV